MTIIDGDTEQILRPTPPTHDVNYNNETEKKHVYSQDPIAIIGMGCRLPGNSNSPHALWKFLEKGGCARNEPPSSRFNFNTHYDGSRKPKTMRSPGGMFLENIDPSDFDAPFFSISSADALAMDPQQRQLLEVVYECLENAGISLESLDGAAIGCFVGSYAADYADMQSRDPDDRVPGVTVGVGRAILSNRLSHFLNVKGPSMTIDTACSGSLVGLDVACRYLQTREINGAIVAAANLYLSPEHVMDTGAMKGASSLTGKCHTFDEKADGYIKAEAVNAVMLKRLDDAVRDGDPIRAVIRGTATNSDGRTPGIASPSAEAQASAIRAAYANAGITTFNDTTYLECHGTGTQAGDPTEVSGASSVFASGRDQPLIIGSIKSNIGHSEPAAGISGLLKAVMALENGVIPGNPTFLTPSPKIQFEELKVRASRMATPWPEVPLKRASVNSFGYGGSNAHVVLDEAKQWADHVSSYRRDEDFDEFFSDSKVEETPFTLVFSANDESALRGNLKALSNHLANPNVSVKIPDLAYTLSERRTRHFHRGYLVTNSTNLHESGLNIGKKGSDPVRIGFVFTGQGAQWSQMGKQLVETFPQAKRVIDHLDKVLQTVSNPPKWSLLEELTETRDPKILRRPEFSQPLVTALQLAIVAVFNDLNISPTAVVGHSSGEIAAACAAGYLTPDAAIKAAFYRGQAAVLGNNDKSRPDVGMLAAGLGPKEVSSYLSGFENEVMIACYNSPSSVTLSGDATALGEVQTRLVEDGHFARRLQVDLAYHSRYMNDIGDIYQDMLEQENFTSMPGQNGGPNMFSSVSGEELHQRTDIAYWKANMVSPVLFEEAMTKMISGRTGVNFVIEIGPSGALAGPISQIKKAVSGSATAAQYCTAWSRGQDAINSLFDVAGRLFIADVHVDFAKLHRTNKTKPSVIVDLPNYTWNHSVKYWYESEASKDWRYRLFPHHDLIGTKVLGTSYRAPIWKKTLQVEDLPWLKDHKMGADIVFPAAAFLAMAIEGMYQINQAAYLLEDKPRPKNPCYRVRDSTFPKALVLEEGKKAKLMLSLSRRVGKDETWHEFRISSLVDELWVEHCSGIVRVEEGFKRVAPEGTLAPLEHPAPGQLWYKAMKDAGYGFGPLFQKHLETECISGQRTSRSIVDLSEPPSAYHQSSYHMHPACIDGCLQTSAPALWKGNRSSVNAVLIPAIIDDILVTSQDSPGDISQTGLSVASAKYVGLGRPEDTKNYMANAIVYDQRTGAMLFEVKGMRFHRLETEASSHTTHKFSRLEWRPDITFMTQDGLEKLEDSRSSNIDDDFATIDELIHLLAHKKPRMEVAEIDLLADDSHSIWLGSTSKAKSASRKGLFATTDARTLVNVQEKYVGGDSVDFKLFDTTKGLQVEAAGFDTVIVRIGFTTTETLRKSVKEARALLHEGGHLLLVEHRSDSVLSTTANTQFLTILNDCGFEDVRSIVSKNGNGIRSVSIGAATSESMQSNHATIKKDISIFQFNPQSGIVDRIKQSLIDYGWKISERNFAEELQPNGTVLVLDDLSAPVLPEVTAEQWEELKKLSNMGHRILWITEGSQYNVTKPDNAMIHGLSRTIRAEDPSISFTTLDLESASGSSTVPVINTVLCRIDREAIGDNELVERGGVIYVSRLFADEPVNRFSDGEKYGQDMNETAFHATATTIRMRAERLGTLDSLCYGAVKPEELPLGENRVEVEIEAAGLNFKDLAVTMGIVPENEHLLGLEGAGTIRRPGSTSYKVGDRVLVFEKGTFANRIIATTERVYPIPYWMSYEEASTLASVFLVSLYSLYDLANTQPGQRVLIHSATGGLGVACIQICKYIGAEVYATAGTTEKRKWLEDNFQIPASNIFNSRTTEFATQLMAATKDEGVDVIINSLTGELLEESWRCIREGGTMVELGKKDMLDRKTLAMEPFGRNASYRCFDMAHKHVTDAVIARLLRKLMPLVEQGILEPIAPIKIFPFTDIQAAFRYMRGANHMGKIVISNEGKEKKEIKVMARPASKKLHLRHDVSYLLVGGLKGLCGSLAIELARNGAKNLIVLARSGYGDNMSRMAIKNIEAEGCNVQLMVGDVSNLQDVRRIFKEAHSPIAGLVQGAMVLRDKIYTSMTVQDFHDAVTAKHVGTWNLHKVAMEESLNLDFFSMLSSISGVVGQRGQANYAAANVFLDSFAVYRQSIGLKANSIDLGAVEEVGYISRNTDLLQIFDTSTWSPINESQFHRIVRYSILQQISPINSDSASQLISGLAVPLGSESKLLSDARFGGLCFGNTSPGTKSDSKDKELQAFHLLVQNKADAMSILDAAVVVINLQFQNILRLSEPMEPAKSLSSYGLDSLAAVELRNWIKKELSVELTTLDINNARSLIALCEKIVAKT